METLWVAGSSPVSPPKYEASSSVVEQRYLRFVEMQKTFLFHSKACVVGSNPTLPPKKNILKGFTKQNLFTIFKSNKNKNRKKIFIYNIKGNKMNKNFNIEIVAFAAERIAVFAERVFAIDNSVHRFK